MLTSLIPKLIGQVFNTLLDTYLVSPWEKLVEHSYTLISVQQTYFEETITYGEIAWQNFT